MSIITFYFSCLEDTTMEEAEELQRVDVKLQTVASELGQIIGM
jgi:hypothetical protein